MKFNSRPQIFDVSIFLSEPFIVNEKKGTFKVHNKRAFLFTVLGALVLGCCGWCIWRFFKKRRNKDGKKKKTESVSFDNFFQERLSMKGVKNSVMKRKYRELVRTEIIYPLTSSKVIGLSGFNKSFRQIHSCEMILQKKSEILLNSFSCEGREKIS